MKNKILFIVLFLIVLMPLGVDAKEINIYLFYGKECPHCEKEREFLKKYQNEDKEIKIYEYEVWYNDDNQKLWETAQNLLGEKAKSVPYLVIGQEVITGYMEKTTSKKITDTINYYKWHSYKDVLGEELGIIEKTDTEDSKIKKTEVFNLPIIGPVNAKEVSLPFVAALIGFIDGFNPCAMWVLLFLISMLLGMKNKKRMWLLGLTFIATSGFIYLLFMVSWLNFATLTSKVVLIRILIGIFASIFGIISIRRYYKSKNKEAVGCEVTNDSKRKKMILKIKEITSQKKLVLSLIGIVTLAVSVNVIELLCSLGLPLVFTQMLSIADLSVFAYGFYLLIYIIFFLIDDIVIFAIAMKTLEIKAISNKYSKYSHLIGGIIMILIGLLMIIKPEWLMLNF